MTETEYRNKLRAMTAEQHFEYFQANGERLRDSLKGTAEHAYEVCSQEAVNDLKALLYHQEFTADNIPPLKTTLTDHEFFLYKRYEAAGGGPAYNFITIVARDTECYTPVIVEMVDYSAGYHKATPTLVEMQNNEKGNCTTKLK